MTPVYSCREKGRMAEAEVYRRFRALGFSVLAANYFVPSLGELDLILNRGRFLYFVEVKSVFAPACRLPAALFGSTPDRDGDSFPHLPDPLQQISPIKLQRIRQTAAAYIRHHQMMRYWPAFWAVGCRMSSDGRLESWQVVPMA